MAFVVVAVEADEFSAWLDAQRQPAAVPADSTAARGAAAFLSNGCSACHQIRGTLAAGQIAPDLTHVGGRLSIAAGTLTNDRDAFVEWIRRTDQIKPGVHMPAFRTLASDDLVALAAYLDSLR
jgi:cytochrome c oxidase subunit 2